MDTQVDVSEYVKEAREMMRLTSEAFGEKLGLSRQTVWRYENGDPVPKHVRLAIVALLPKRVRRARTLAALLM